MSRDADVFVRTEFRYALVNRPVGIGTVPRGFLYQVEPRPPAGAPHHALARHGILVTPRELTLDELRSFELSPLIDEAGIDAIADRIARGGMGEYAAEYVQLSCEEPDAFQSGVLQALERVDKGVRYSICNSALLAQLVCRKLEANAMTARQVPEIHTAPRDE